MNETREEVKAFSSVFFDVFKKLTLGDE